MAVEKTYKTVTEADVKAALMEAKKLREDEGKAIDDKRKAFEDKVAKKEVK